VQSFFVLCDSFNVPLVMLVDQPGFLIGMEGEQRGVTGKVMNWLNAMTLVTVPKISVIMRKSYGLAVSNMGAGGNADEVACWVTAEVSFMKPDFGARVVFGVDPEKEPDRYRDAVARMSKGTTPYEMAAIYTAQDVIDPRDNARVADPHARRASAAHERRGERAPDAHLADELLRCGRASLRFVVGEGRSGRSALRSPAPRYWRAVPDRALRRAGGRASRVRWR
jgi:methylmalonyl-CoA decarboxylase subunit alpha